MRYFLATLCVIFLLAGCSTPTQKVEKQTQALNEALDEAFGTAGKTQKLAGQSVAEAESIDSKTPKQSPLKPETSKHVATTRAVETSAGDTVNAVEAAKKPAAALGETALTHAKELEDAKKDSWLVWAFRLAPIVLGIGLAIFVGVFTFSGMWSFLNVIKPPVVGVMVGIAALGVVNLILAMIPPWLWWTGGIAALLIVVFALLYRFVPAVRAMSQTIADQTNAAELAASVKNLGGKIGAMLAGLGTKVDPKE